MKLFLLLKAFLIWASPHIGKFTAVAVVLIVLLVLYIIREMRSSDDTDTSAVEHIQGTWTCSCGQQNQGKFCVACGKPVPTNQPIAKRKAPLSPQKKFGLIVCAAIAAFLLLVAGISSFYKGPGTTTNAPKTEQTEKAPVAATTEDKTAPPKASVQYATYTNSRFGFVLDYPTTFMKGKASANGDGMTFTSPDGKATITASAGYNSSNASIQTLYNQAVHNVRGDIGYHTLGDSWYVITWINNGDSHYQKVMFKNNVRSTFEMVFPDAEKDTYSPIVDHIEGTFKIN